MIILFAISKETQNLFGKDVYRVLFAFKDRWSLDREVLYKLPINIEQKLPKCVHKENFGNPKSIVTEFNKPYYYINIS